jgi:hypothetical protein
MTIYDDLKPVVTELLGEFKQGTINLIQITSGTGAADDPGAPTETTHALSATVKGVSFKYVRDGFALSSDLVVIAAVVEGITPSKNDFIDIDSIRYKIIEDMSVPAAGTRVAWKFLVRK